MTKELLAEQLYEAALRAQWWRMKKQNETEKDLNTRKVGCEFNDLFNAAKDHYLAMADYLLNNKNLF